MTCRMPFTNLEILPNGQFGVCCISKFRATKVDGTPYVYGEDSVADVLESDSLREFRKEFEREEKSHLCQTCWQDERVNRESKRQIENRRFKDHKNAIRSLDIKPGNVCNLKCRICSSYASSRWIADEFKLHGRSHFPLHDWPERYGFEDLHQLAEHLEYIEVSGGEPFMLGTQWEFVRWLKDNGYDKNIHIQYHTNGTLYSDKWIESLIGFKKVQIALSIDGIGKRFEYLRHPANWDTVHENWRRYAAIDEIHTSVSHSINALNVYYIGEFADLVNEIGTEVYWNMVNNVMPVHQIANITPVLVHLRKTLPNDTSLQVNPLYPADNWLFEHLRFAGPGGYRDADLIPEILQIDRLRNEDYSKTFPEMWEVLNFAQ